MELIGRVSGSEQAERDKIVTGERAKITEAERKRNIGAIIRVPAEDSQPKEARDAARGVRSASAVFFGLL